MVIQKFGDVDQKGYHTCGSWTITDVTFYLRKGRGLPIGQNLLACDSIVINCYLRLGRIQFWDKYWREINTGPYLRCVNIV